MNRVLMIAYHFPPLAGLHLGDLPLQIADARVGDPAVDFELGFTGAAHADARAAARLPG